jgi:hypothetical protein
MSTRRWRACSGPVWGRYIWRRRCSRRCWTAGARARDEPSAAFAAWHATAIEQIEPGRDRAHVRAYATWQVAHQLARTSQSGRPTVSAQKYARSLVSEAIKLTRWLHAQQLELRDLRQDLLDAELEPEPAAQPQAEGVFARRSSAGRPRGRGWVW